MELKRCPFCGSTAVLRGKNGGKWWIIICENNACQCQTPGKIDKAKLIEIWNRRTEK